VLVLFVRHITTFFPFYAGKDKREPLCPHRCTTFDVLLGHLATPARSLARLHRARFPAHEGRRSWNTKQTSHAPTPSPTAALAFGTVPRPLGGHNSD
jgi:hypothetical protein